MTFRGHFIFLVAATSSSPLLFGDAADGRNTCIKKMLSPEKTREQQHDISMNNEILQLPELGAALFPSSLVEARFIFVEFFFWIFNVREIATAKYIFC